MSKVCDNLKQAVETEMIVSFIKQKLSHHNDCNAKPLKQESVGFYIHHSEWVHNEVGWC